ncbi:VWA domain-containing protein [Spirochaeta cellobiosiphila]|uniref:VWA domain-containing protein n=1 Tax=Spirochaeta cellobiosiphila TaxID=504483 RepID=UPI0004253A1F|nr:VWA domain-containing protein [Spirochaeta cellobiosiphila]
MNKILAFLFIGISASLGAINVNLNQIDTARLLLNQEVDLYFSVTDGDSSPLKDITIDQVKVSESYDGGAFDNPKVPLQLTRMADLDRGINFFFLIDNSGSMYDGKGELPANQAKNALLRFAGSISNPKDTIGLASFNTHYVQHIEPGTHDRVLGTYLDSIIKPEGKDAYTELFWAIDLASRNMTDVYGRKALIVLSDGENFSYTEHLNQPHPEFGEVQGSSLISLEALKKAGVSLFAIDFGGHGDPALRELAIKSGGTSYKAYNQEELLGVYKDIKERILTEYVATYRAKQPRSDKQFVRIDIDYGQEQNRATQYFYSENLMGEAALADPLPYLILFPLAGLVLSLIGFIKWESAAKVAGLEVIGPNKRSVSSGTIALNQANTVIGSSTEANLTISGQPSIADEHVTVMRNDKTGDYTLVSKSEVMVNNNPVKKRKLTSGDVINIEGTTIVFDEPKK